MDLPFAIGVIADDFTGAMDSGAQFARYGLDTAFAVTTIPDSAVVILNTASREIDPVQARERCASAAQRMRGRMIFKKIDSTLRGHIAAEIRGLLDVVGSAKIVVCPAAPVQGRTVQNGMLYVHGVPLHESPFRDDPVFPARTSIVADRIGIKAGHIALQAVRAGTATLAEQIAASPDAVVIIDALDEADLARIGAAIVQTGSIPCGALGLANAWTRALTGRQPEGMPFSLPANSGPVLIVSGSASATTHAQIDMLGRHPETLVLRMEVNRGDISGEDVLNLAAWEDCRAVVLCPAKREIAREAEWLSFGQTVSRLASEIIRQRQPACVVITGGETANHLIGLLGVESVQVLGEAAPGVPFGRLNGGAAHGLTLVTKAGGFGAPDCLEKIVYGLV